MRTKAGRALLAAPWKMLPGGPLMPDAIEAIEAEAYAAGRQAADEGLHRRLEALADHWDAVGKADCAHNLRAEWRAAHAEQASEPGEGDGRS